MNRAPLRKTNMNSKAKPTQRMIAEAAGVSTYTVSRALGGFSDVSSVTAERIRRIAAGLGYTPNAFARSLSTRRSGLLGMIVPALGPETAYSEVISAVTRAAAEKGLCVMLGSCGRDRSLENAYCRMMCESRVETLIMVPIGSDVSDIHRICDGVVPVLFFGGKTGRDETPSITIDYAASGRQAVCHLADLGHRDIALFLYDPDNKTIAMKRDSFCEAMLERGLTPRILIEGDSADTFAAGFRLTERLLSEKSLPTAIWCASDLMALGVLEAARKAGLSIPRDLSLVGHDNLFLTGIPSISLTTFTLPKEEMGMHAIRIALSVSGRSDEPVELRKTFTASLVERGSTVRPPCGSHQRCHERS